MEWGFNPFLLNLSWIMNLLNLLFFVFLVFHCCLLWQYIPAYYRNIHGLYSPSNWNWWVLWRFYLDKYNKQYHFSFDKLDSSPVLYHSYISKGNGVKLHVTRFPEKKNWTILICSKVFKKYIVVFACAQVMHIPLYSQAHLDVVQGPLSSMGIFPLLH